MAENLRQLMPVLKNRINNQVNQKNKSERGRKTLQHAGSCMPLGAPS